MTDLQRARTEQVNKESAARLAKQKADQAVVDAEASQDAAVSALTEAQQTFRDQQAEIDRLAAERNDRAGEARRRRAVVGARRRTRGRAAGRRAGAPARPADRWDPAATGIAVPRRPTPRCPTARPRSGT